jgi:hypothetical protein
VRCKSAKVKRFGKTSTNQQRWYCLECHRTFIWKLPSTHHLQWFKKWIVEGYSVRQLSSISKLSRATLKRCIKYWLEHPPQSTYSLSNVRHIICDGTFLEHRTGIYAVMNADTKRLVYAGYDIPEGARVLPMVYRSLASAGLSPTSVTVDGNPQQIKYLRQVWPTIILQRCVVHVQRQGLSWCRRNPKRTDVKHLRKIFLRICSVRTFAEVREFIADVTAWEDRFGPAIVQSSDRGWVFSDLLRARSMLLKALPDLFHYVMNSRIPSSTNTLESYFSRLKEHYRHHRGLAVHHRDAYFTWYFYLLPGKISNKK